MSDRFFSLLERLQKIDSLLRRAQSLRGADPLTVVRLRRHKEILRARLAGLQSEPIAFARA
ncbi:DUF465 domain-containing protein [Novosphingobium aquimarinum]|uniref:DUF465 domain-containing protein n=1 Tax=Novosphingobium aquimarinum TaxID=2682494 RepID=UPI0012EC0FCD|nr:DUF465 domain-containing protein [Novosphingobium aquimarinum]